VVESNIPFVLVSFRYFLFAEADTFSQLLQELQDPTVSKLFKTEYLAFLNSLLVVVPSRKDVRLLVDQLWNAGVTYDALTALKVYIATVPFESKFQALDWSGLVMVSMIGSGGGRELQRTSGILFRRSGAV
jgi:hypothetical protein